MKMRLHGYKSLQNLCQDCFLMSCCNSLLFLSSNDLPLHCPAFHVTVVGFFNYKASQRMTGSASFRGYITR